MMLCIMEALILVINQKMLLSIRSVRWRYENYLHQKLLQNTEENRIKDERRKITSEEKKTEEEADKLQMGTRSFLKQIKEMKINPKSW